MEDLPSQEKIITFDAIATSKGYSPQKAPRGEHTNVTHVLKAKGKSGKAIDILFDVKKIKNKKQSQEWLWIEFKNSQGKKVGFMEMLILLPLKERMIFLSLTAKNYYLC